MSKEEIKIIIRIFWNILAVIVGWNISQNFIDYLKTSNKKYLFRSFMFLICAIIIIVKATKVIL